jgi:hypothetical protein
MPGYKIDAHLAEILKQIDDSFFYKNTTQHRKFHFDGGLLNVELTSMGDGTLKAYRRIKNNNPTRLDKFIYGVKNKNARMVLNLEPPGKAKLIQKESTMISENELYHYFCEVWIHFPIKLRLQRHPAATP